MFSKRELEGYLEIDHRESPGFTEEQARAARFGKTMPVGSALIQRSTITCSHCERIVVLNPDRARSRGYCPKCDRHVCDECETVRVVTGVCRPFKQVIDEFVEDVERGRTPRFLCAPADAPATPPPALILP
jgi:hypothetical protein